MLLGRRSFIVAVAVVVAVPLKGKGRHTTECAFPSRFSWYSFIHYDSIIFKIFDCVHISFVAMNQILFFWIHYKSGLVCIRFHYPFGRWLMGKREELPGSFFEISIWKNEIIVIIILIAVLCGGVAFTYQLTFHVSDQFAWIYQARRLDKKIYKKSKA